MTRRTLIGTGFAAGFGAAAHAEGAQNAQRGEGDERVAGAISDLRQTLEQQGAVDRDQVEFEQAPWRTVARIREQQRLFLRASEKYPDFVDVGIQVWESVYDWYVQTHQPVTVNRRADGRYIMLFPFTTLVLRPEFELNFVGFGYDGDRAPRAP